MNDLLARIDELRRAQPDVMGDKEWFLSGSRVLLRQRQDWRHWRWAGLEFLFFGWCAVAIAVTNWERFSRGGILSGLGSLGVLLFCLWISGFAELVFRETLFELDWQQQVMTKPRDRGEVTSLSEIECIVGESYVRDDEFAHFCDSPYAVLRDGRSFPLPYLLGSRSLRRNTAAYGFLLDKPALYLNETQHLADLYLKDEQPVSYWPPPRRIDLSRLWAAEAERLSPNAWRDDWSEPPARESAPQESDAEKGE
jgi:hypothetical protein